MSSAEAQSRILWIDDDEVLVRQAQTYLDDFGYQVQFCAVEEDIFALLKSFNPEIVICALALQAKCGCELVGEIKALHPRLPVIVAADEQQTSTVLQALRKGAFDYITKPLGDLSALLYTLQAALADSQDEISSQDELEIALSELRFNRAALVQDAKMASLFQASLLPEQQFQAGKVEISWRMPLRPKASRYFLDVLPLSEQYASFYIADFGENPDDAAFASGVLKVVFNEAFRELSQQGSPLLMSPASVMGRAGHYLKSLSLTQTPSLVYGLVDVQEGRMRWASADFDKGPYIWLKSATQLLADTGPELAQSEESDYDCNEFLVEESMPLVFSHLNGQEVLRLAESTEKMNWPATEQDLLCQPATLPKSCSDLFSLVVKRKD